MLYSSFIVFHIFHKIPFMKFSDVSLFFLEYSGFCSVSSWVALIFLFLTTYLFLFLFLPYCSCKFLFLTTCMRSEPVYLSLKKKVYARTSLNSSICTNSIHAEDPLEWESSIQIVNLLHGMMKAHNLSKVVNVTFSGWR
jgi:hypothetical protein